MYTDERNIQIVIALLKAHGIRYIVASPGSMNMTFVMSVQDDKDFQVFSCVDERSAAYMACGIAAEKKQPVVLSCTGATASRNYMSGLTEAYYRKLPILAITSLSSRQNVGMLIAQQLDRSQLPKDVVVKSFYIPSIKEEKDEIVCERETNTAILSLSRNGGGPVHIDLGSSMSLNQTDQLLCVRTIRRYSHLDKLPIIPKGRIGIMIGAHSKVDAELSTLIDNFCSTYDAIVYSTNPKSYIGEYAANVSLLFSQFNYIGELNRPDLCIQIGEVTSDAVGFQFHPKEVWRVNEDGLVKDRYNCLTNIFQMTEKEFFSHYAATSGDKRTQLDDWRNEDAYIRTQIPELPLSNGWIARTLSKVIPESAELYLGIANSVRAWDYIDPPRLLYTNANIGGYGIDGCVSTMIGASIVSPNKQFYGIFGDLAFFYDMNCLGNRHVGNNLHIIVINNDGGQQFRNSDHPCYSLGYDSVNKYIAASGHNGHKSSLLIKHFAEDLGFSYLSANSKNEFLSQLPSFTRIGRSIVFEIFTKAAEEEFTFRILRSLLGEPKQKDKSLKTIVKETIGVKKVKAVKTLLGL